MSDYRAPALVCANGHLLTGDIKTDPGRVQKFCPDCGTQCFAACPSCDAIIPGDHYYADWQGRLQPGEQIRVAPRFCGQCGNAYPWTDAAITAARTLIGELELEAADKSALVESLPELIRDTPMTRAATVRWSRILRKLGEGTANALRDTLVNVASEAVSKALWGR